MNTQNREMCRKCNSFIQFDSDRINWFNQITRQNIELQQRLTKANELLSILLKEYEKRKKYLLEDYLNMIQSKIDNHYRECDVEGEEYFKRKMKELEELTELLSLDSQSHILKDYNTEKEYILRITELKAQAEFYRDTLFNEVKHSNELRQLYLTKLNQISLQNKGPIADLAKKEVEKYLVKIKARYQETIKSTKEELDRQTDMVRRLRKHNSALYQKIRENKQAYEEKVQGYETEIKELKRRLNRMQLLSSIKTKK